MIRSRTKGLFNAYIVAQSLALQASFWIYLLSLKAAFGMDLDSSRYFSYSLIALFGLLIHLFGIDLTSTNLLTADPLRAARLSIRQTAYVAGALMFMLLLTKDTYISRLFLFSYLGVLLAVLFGVNMLAPPWLCRFFFSGRHKTNTLLIGPPERLKDMEGWLRIVRNYGVEIVGVLCRDENRSIDKIPVLGAPEDLPKILSDVSIQSVLLLEIPSDRERLGEILNSCEVAGARLSAVNSLSEAFRHSLRYFHHFGHDFVSIREEPLQDPIARVSKRAFDVLLTLPIVIVALPILTLLVLVIHRRHSPGPLFFRQARTGLDGQPFEILKFRTMSTHNDDPARQAEKSDPRIFTGAHFLRRTSIDEFPQFFNVLRGDMSIVGPRPHMLEHDAKFAAVFRSYHVRSFIKPGLTGLAQIRGYRGEAKSDTDIRRRVECDIEYIERWSLLMDILVIFRTAWQVIRPPRSAY
ncbi:MAG: exopolysaccharide biosynthesis polyprenyl glycosylphosphotransferase [Chthoniobacterales bacterium]